MKTRLPSHYTDAIAFALTPSREAAREFRSERIDLFVQSPPEHRNDLARRIYLEAFEKVPGGVTFLNWWAPARPAGVREFFRGLAERTPRFVSKRPYRLGQGCDGTINSPVLHAYRVACEALGLDADRLYKTAYPERDDDPPDWADCRRHAEWQGGVVWPEQWDRAAVDGIAGSLTAINYHGLRSEFEAPAVAHTINPRCPMNAHTRKLADRAIALLKALTRARLRGSEITLPDGRRFDAREFDDCFESGNGEDVVILIMLAHCTDPELRHAFTHDLAGRYVACANWAKKLADWEARQTGLLPLD